MLKWAGPSTLKSINDPDHYDVFSYVSKYVLTLDSRMNINIIFIRRHVCRAQHWVDNRANNTWSEIKQSEPNKHTLPA